MGSTGKLQSGGRGITRKGDDVVLELLEVAGLFRCYISTDRYHW